MFGNSGKIQPRAARKKHGTAYYAAMSFTCVIEFALGTNAAFLMYQNFKITIYSMLQSEIWASILTVILAFAFGAGVFLGGLWTFAGFVDNLEDAKAYRETYGTWRWPEILIWTGLILVITLDFTTLCFRYSFFDRRGALSLFSFSCVLILLPPVLGPFLYVLEHTPRERRLAKVRTYMEQIDVDEIEQVARSMDPDLRSRWLNGDTTARDEHYERVNAQREASYQLEQQRMADNKRKQADKNRPLV